MGNAVGKYYIEKAFNGNSKNEIKELIGNIKEAMLKRIPETTWLDKATADYDLKKIKNMNDENIGFPDYLLEPKEVLKEYEGLEIDPEIFFNTLLNYNLYYIKKNVKLLLQPTDRNALYYLVQVYINIINCYYL